MAYQKKAKKEENSNIITNPEDLKKFKQTLVTITHYLQLMEDNKDAISETIKESSETFGIDKKYVRKLAKVMFKHNYQDIQEENQHFEFLYEAMIGGKIITTDPLDDAE
jgi:vacuolar-type H+-ATPase subunit D/Vma8